MKCSNPVVVSMFLALKVCSLQNTLRKASFQRSGNHITGMIPTNVFQSLNEAHSANSRFLLILLVLRFPTSVKEKRDPIINGVNAIVDAMVWMINKVMIIAPLGVFGPMAEAGGTFGFGALWSCLLSFIVYIAAILIFFGFVAYPLMIQIFTKTSAKKFPVRQ
ncbi:cation:dicarboxylase symporter family transporter [Vibrio lentus]|nr:cation:dicarboxylase symporter family transporter [Vibrio lentus]